MNKANTFINQKLEERKSAGNLRALKAETSLIDFCSNDYLGFARSLVLKNNIDAEITYIKPILNGSTGSRLLSGNTEYTQELEQHLANLHHGEAGLIFNSGYDANIGLFSSLPQRGDTIITDELIHASIIDGTRLSHANRYTFKHNDIESLERKLKHAQGVCYVVVESVYSMDGDTPPIDDILNLTDKYNAHLIIDEAHAVGLFGFGLVSDKQKRRVFARIVTFGKALGCHGAIILGSKQLQAFLINFARSFIYTTAAPVHQIASIKIAYNFLQQSTLEIDTLKQNISLFKQKISSSGTYPLIPSDSAIQCILLKNNELAKSLASQLQNNGLDVRAILSPTVAQGSERIRICLHSFNTENEIELLTNTINKFIDGH